MKKYILISPASQTSKQMLADLENYKNENFLMIKEPYKFRNKIQKKLFSIYYRINSKINLPLNFVWNRISAISNIDFTNKDEYYLILGNGIFNYYSSKWLNSLKKKYNIHYIIYFIDPLSGLNSEYMKKNIFSLDYDYIYTFDYNDSKKINAIHTMNLYSKKEVRKHQQKDNSVFFVGTNKKNRVYTMDKIWDKLIKNNIECNFNIVNVPDELQTKNGVNYNKMMSYDDVLDEIQKYSCILEILQEGQTGVTLRYYEAVAYNKKLITNNQLVKKLPFYDERFMYVFENIEEIDPNWIRECIDIDYGYKNNFSPIKFIEEIMVRTNHN